MRVGSPRIPYEFQTRSATGHGIVPERQQSGLRLLVAVGFGVATGDDQFTADLKGHISITGKFNGQGPPPDTVTRLARIRFIVQAGVQDPGVAARYSVPGIRALVANRRYEPPSGSNEGNPATDDS